MLRNLVCLGTSVLVKGSPVLPLSFVNWWICSTSNMATSPELTRLNLTVLFGFYLPNCMENIFTFPIYLFGFTTEMTKFG